MLTRTPLLLRRWAFCTTNRSLSEVEQISGSAQRRSAGVPERVGPLGGLPVPKVPVVNATYWPLHIASPPGAGVRPDRRVARSPPAPLLTLRQAMHWRMKATTGPTSNGVLVSTSTIGHPPETGSETSSFHSSSTVRTASKWPA